MKTYKVNLTYFAKSGKYKYEGSYRTSQEWMWQVFDEVKAMETHPGIVNKWTDGYILVQSPRHPNEFPGLVVV